MYHLIKNVKNIIDKICPISQKSFNEIENLLEVVSFKKGNTFILKGKHNTTEYFIINGICKSYLINPKGEEITLSIFIENSVLSPQSIRTSNTISNLNFKALTDIDLVMMDAKKFENLMINNLEIRQFGHRVLQNELISKVEKEIGLASLTAKERLQAFRNTYKHLENRIPHTDIASYLGITNISLSRLRKELSE